MTAQVFWVTFCENHSLLPRLGIKVTCDSFTPSALWNWTFVVHFEFCFYLCQWSLVVSFSRLLTCIFVRNKRRVPLWYSEEKVIQQNKNERKRKWAWSWMFQASLFLSTLTRTRDRIIQRKRKVILHFSHVATINLWYEKWKKTLAYTRVSFTCVTSPSCSETFKKTFLLNSHFSCSFWGYKRESWGRY